MKKRLFFVATAALVPGLAMLAFNELSYRAERAQEVHRQALEAGRQAGSEIERIVEGVDGLLTAVAAIPAVFNADVAGCTEALKAVARSVASIRTVFLLDREGRIVCDSSGGSSGLNLSDRSYFRDALEKPGVAIGEYTMSRLSNAAILPIGKAVRDANGAVLGVLATGIRLEWLGERLRERGLAPGGALTIADRSGVILARQPNP
ncbi:MAG: cache domain-containing protein, partial [Bosea sp. (in: a-proteobacteria)]